MAARKTSSSKPQALVQKRGAAKAPAKKAAAKRAPKKAAARTGHKVMLADFVNLGVPKPRTGQAAVELAVRAGVINASGDLKPRFR